MPVKLWIRGLERGLFECVCDMELSEYPNGKLTGLLENPGLLAKIGKQFVLGKKRVWEARGTGQALYFVRINNNSAYPDGLILTPYSAEDVHSHLKSRTIDEKTKIHREELTGSDMDDFVGRVFNTYCGPLVRRNMERDNHLVLYSTLKIDSA